MATSSVPTFPVFAGLVQDLTYVYDSVGNITKITDNSETDTRTVVDHVYDDLYRLTRASTTNASSTPYLRTYTYDALGNITNKSDQGAYSYEGNTGSSYANPHAVTEIGSIAFEYDENGNLASTTAGLQNTWDYNNRLTQSSEGGTIVTYQYDHTGQRVSKDNGSVATIYPSSLYETAGATTTKHIYAGDLLVASIESDTPGPKVYHVHADHLNSTRVTTDEFGYVNQLLSYYPFGSHQIDTQNGGLTQMEGTPNLRHLF